MPYCEKDTHMQERYTSTQHRISTSYREKVPENHEEPLYKRILGPMVLGNRWVTGFWSNFYSWNINLERINFSRTTVNLKLSNYEAQ